MPPRKVFLFIVLLISMSSIAQNIKGLVIDLETKMAVPYASIQINRPVSQGPARVLTQVCKTNDKKSPLSPDVWYPFPCGTHRGRGLGRGGSRLTGYYFPLTLTLSPAGARDEK